MTAEELSALIKAEIGENERLHRILDRIRDGKANLTDSELYAAITARITAQQMQRNVLSLEKREAAFVGITRERYTDTFTVFSAVQRILDAENGIHIRPQKPPFETGRAHKIGHSLEDKTVPDSTIERRARSATENFCMSHHDDCMKVNAEFRARAGLQSYAIRDGSAKCCDWCADVSGKYPANETPAGFWGRHDNCKCSILYESKRSGRQLLRGTSKKWEQVAPGAGAEPLVRLTHEQAMQIQQEKQLTVLTHEQALALQEKHGTVVLTPEQAAKLQAEKALTILSGNGTMISEESAMYRKSGSGSVEPMPKKQFRRIRKAFIKQGGVIQQNAETDEYLRNVAHAEGSTYNATTILLKQNPSRASVFEELIHTEQYRNGRNDGSTKSRIINEIEAQEKLLRNAKVYKLTEPEIIQTQKALAKYKKDLEEYYKNGGE